MRIDIAIDYCHVAATHYRNYYSFFDLDIINDIVCFNTKAHKDFTH